jgi:peptidoglycan/LPS O-acetylase OafA/YrhL
MVITWVSLRARNVHLVQLAAFLQLAIAATVICVAKVSPEVASAIAAPALVVFLAICVRPRKPLVRRALAALGNTTYASYLVHFPLELLVALALVDHDSTITQSPWFLFSFTSRVFLLSAVIYSSFERPVQRTLRNRLDARRWVVEPHKVGTPIAR